MNIAKQFLEIDFFLTQNRLVAVLKEMAVAPVSSVETDGIPGQQTSHYRGNWRKACFEKQMTMIGKQRPSITTGTALIYDCAQSFQKVDTIVVIPKNIAFFDSSGNHMV
jgi:hypothetical protein